MRHDRGAQPKSTQGRAGPGAFPPGLDGIVAGGIARPEQRYGGIGGGDGVVARRHDGLDERVRHPALGAGCRG
jgi:hypothetical protein